MRARCSSARRFGVASGVVAVMITTSLDVQADPAEANGPDWAFGRPGGEVALGAASAMSLLAVALPQRRSDWGPWNARPRDDRWGFASDFSGSAIGALWQLAGGYGLEVSYYREHGVSDAYRRAWRTTLMEGEAVLLGVGLTYALKRLTGRCRPRAWRTAADGTGRCDVDHPEHDSFPSGHTVTVSAVAGSRLLLGARSDGASAARFGGFAFAETAALVTGVMRVLAGAHSWEDVLGGWGVGHAAGVLVSLAHPMQAVAHVESGSQPAPQPAATLAWSGRF